MVATNWRTSCNDPIPPATRYQTGRHQRPTELHNQAWPDTNQRGPGVPGSDMLMDIEIIDPRLSTTNFGHYAHSGDAGLDLYACCHDPREIWPAETFEVSAGFRCAIPEGHFGMIVPRSGTGSKGLWLKNVIGILDFGYIGPIIIKLYNSNPAGSRPITIEPLQRVAQMIIIPCASITPVFVERLKNRSTRGEGGFGSSGE